MFDQDASSPPVASTAALPLRDATSIARPRRGTLHRAANRTRLAFLLPAALLFTTVMVVPVGFNLFYSLTDWNGFTADFAFVGLDNFVQMFSDATVARAVRNTFAYVILQAPLQVGLGLLLALALFGPGRGKSFARTILVLPMALSGVVIGLLGNVIFDPRTGVLAGLEDVPVLGVLARDWLGNEATALYGIVAMSIWSGVGFAMLIFIAGLSGVPQELYEAARLDGASRLGVFRHVTWPLIAPAFTINVVLVAISGLKVFELPYLMTRGGPNGATESIVMLATFQTGFGRFSYSAAVNFSLTVLLLVVSVTLLTILRKREVAA